MTHRSSAGCLAPAALARPGRVGPLTALCVALLTAGAPSVPGIAPPDEPGPFHVGVTAFPAVMSGGRVTQVRVWYTTLEAADAPTRYTIFRAGGSYRLNSPLRAVEGARAVPGSFPLVVYDHGGPPAGTDPRSVANLPLHETMASHGFVVAVALHSANAVARVRDLSRVIDTLLDLSAADGDRLFAAFVGYSEPVAPGFVRIIEIGVITGGTDRFAGASGSYTSQRLTSLTTNETAGSFEGSISSPGS